jgi:hypothetical protein
MITLGVTLLILALIGIGRALLLPLAALLITLGAVFAVLHFVGHSVALLF